MPFLPNKGRRTTGDLFFFRLCQRTTLFAALTLSHPGITRAESPPSVLDTLLPVCTSCHGPNGVSAMSDIPALAGQNEDYLFNTLKKFQSPEGSSELMRSMLLPLNDGELRLLANYFAMQAYERNKQTIDGERVARGNEVYQGLCSICHSDRGRSTTYSEYPLLAGQNLEYMRNTMRNILSRGRAVDIMKREMLALVSPEKVDDAIHFFASQVISPGEVSTAIRMASKQKRRRLNPLR